MYLPKCGVYCQMNEAQLIRICHLYLYQTKYHHFRPEDNKIKPEVQLHKSSYIYWRCVCEFVKPDVEHIGIIANGKCDSQSRSKSFTF